jgi:hypothetical protein
VGFLVFNAGLAVWNIAATRGHGIDWALQTTKRLLVPFLVLELFVFLPASGYFARRAFASHGYRAPDQLSYWQAVRIGLEAFVWWMLAIALSWLAWRLLHNEQGGPTLARTFGLIAQLATARYVIVPRAEITLRRLA